MCSIRGRQHKLKFVFFVCVEYFRLMKILINLYVGGVILPAVEERNNVKLVILLCFVRERKRGAGDNKGTEGARNLT